MSAARANGRAHTHDVPAVAHRNPHRWGPAQRRRTCFDLLDGVLIEKLVENEGEEIGLHMIVQVMR